MSELMPTSSRIAKQQTAGYVPDKSAKKAISDMLRAAGKSPKTQSTPQRTHAMLCLLDVETLLRIASDKPKTKRAKKKTR
jgi:hypothetical protein